MITKDESDQTFRWAKCACTNDLRQKRRGWHKKKVYGRLYLRLSFWTTLIGSLYIGHVESNRMRTAIES